MSIAKFKKWFWGSNPSKRFDQLQAIGMMVMIGSSAYLVFRRIETQKIIELKYAEEKKNRSE